MDSLIVFLIIAIIAVIYVLKGFKIVPQSETRVVERLGRYDRTLQSGINYLFPIIDQAREVIQRDEIKYGDGTKSVVMRSTSRIDLREQVYDFDKQSVITKDNVTMQIDTVVFFRIVDPKMFTYGVEKPMMAIENLTATTLRNIIGDLELDATLTSRDVINSKITHVLDEATDPWGIKINRVELKNIMPPKEIQDSMEKQMKAERERREKILQAEGEKKSAILRAEAEKESAILRAAAVKEAKILEAEGEAEAIKKVQEATAKGIEMINEAKPSDGVIKLKALEAFEKAADGQATKIIVPSEIQGLAGLVTGIAETAKK